MNCPCCLAKLAEKSNFCSACGVKLPQQSKALSAERRDLTVLFCDLVEYTSMAEEYDPEDLREFVNSYKSCCLSTIRKYDGFIAQFLGDGILAYFGYPAAREHDGQQAVRAGLGLVAAISRLSERYTALLNIRPKVRIGIHTGIAVVGNVLHQDHLELHAITGSTPNIAARIQAEAAPNTVLISAKTHSIVCNYFESADLGAYALKGLAKPIHLFHVVAERSTSRRLQALVEDFTFFVGRDQETTLLQHHWNQCLRGNAQVVIISGEPGIGKTHLVHNIRNLLHTGERIHEAFLQCSPFHQSTALFPVSSFFETSVFRSSTDSSHQDRFNKLSLWLESRRLDQQTSINLLCALLSLELPRTTTPLSLPPQKIKELTFDLLIDILISYAKEKPLLFVIEDLHWADASTLELLHASLARIKNYPVTLIITTRPNLESINSFEDGVSRLHLKGLSHDATIAIVNNIAQDNKLNTELMSYIVERTDGIPLFAEEMTKAIIEGGGNRLQGSVYTQNNKPGILPIPSTLKGSLTARLDRMLDAKRVAQVAAIIGREFQQSLLETVVAEEISDVGKNLDQLVEAGLLIRIKSDDESKYSFKHALIQDAAYESLLKLSRRKWHSRVAEQLKTVSPKMAEMEPEILAHHYLESGQWALSLPLWQRAGKLALSKAAMIDAINHFKLYLDLVQRLPDGEEKINAELTGQSLLGLAIMQSSGYGHKEVGIAFTRARQICQMIGDPPETFLVLHGLVKYHLVIGNYEYGLDLAQQLLQTSDHVDNLEMRIESLYVVAAALTWMGRLPEAVSYSRKLLAIQRQDNHNELADIYGEDPFIAAAGHCHWALLIQGEISESNSLIESARCEAFKIGHPWTIQYMMSCSVSALQVKRDVNELMLRSHEMYDFACDFGFPFWKAAAMLFSGWAHAHQGDIIGGLQEMETGIGNWRALGANLATTNFVLRLAEGHLLAGDENAAIVIARESIALINKNKEGLYLADAYRVLGKALHACQRFEQARAAFQRAFGFAKKQRANLFVLATAMDNLRLARAQGDVRDAETILIKSMVPLSEHQDIPIMIEAKALLFEPS
jgi:class 3 adenylate cyclase/tetratricopeptide (TPR) repeat protein